MPSDTNRLAVPTLAKGLHVVVKPCNLRRSLLFKEIAILTVPRGPCLRNPLLMAVKGASLMFPTAPGRRFNATVPEPRRVVIKSGPTGGRRCPRYGTLLKRWSRVRSSWSRSGSFHGTPRPGVARELPFKKPFHVVVLVWYEHVTVGLWISHQTRLLFISSPSPGRTADRVAWAKCEAWL
jgi:hypothetical protein